MELPSEAEALHRLHLATYKEIKVREQWEAWRRDLRMVRSPGSFARNATVTLSGAVIGLKPMVCTDYSWR